MKHAIERKSRKARKAYLLSIFAGLAGFAFLVRAVITLGAQSPSAPASSEWRSYAGDLRNHHYSPLSQITAENFSSLEVAWRFKTDSLGPRPEYKLEGTPLMVNGVLYTTAGTRRSVVALDAATGELRWVHAEPEGARAAASPRQLSGRGVAYWTDGKDERILYVTTGYRLVALDAKTGGRISSFGKDGIVDLKDGVVFGKGQQIDYEAGEIGLHATPAITKDGIVMIGAAMLEGGTPKTHNNTKGMVRGFDVRTGRRLWTFNTIPRPGEFGNDTWLNESWAVNGNVGVWNQIAVDEDLGLAYLPVETPSSDFYGGLRPGNNLFAESIVAIDYKTGVRRWHFQLVHHPIWNMDISAAPILVDLTVGGQGVKAVAVMGKQAFLYLFNRVTGQPIFPIEERRVPQSDVPGEHTSATQPFPTKPPAYDYQGVTLENLIDFTPELHAEALKIAARYKLGPIFTPPPVSKADGPIAGFRSSGGTNWPGGSYDPETHIAYVPSFTAMPVLGLLPPPSKEFSDLPYVSGNVLTGVRYISGPGENVGADAPAAPSGRGGAPLSSTGDSATNANALPQGLPLLKPPYGRITAINLDRGEIVWQVPHGETPDSVRNHPALKGLTIPRTGQSGAVGALVTKTLVIAGDPLATTGANRPRGAMLRAYDKSSGKEVGAVYMPAQQSGTPMTYALNGRQYIVVPISGGNYSGEYLAFALPPRTVSQNVVPEPKWKSTKPINDLPNPYRRDANWAKLPPGMKWGAVIGAEPGPDGNLYVVHRCFENSCAGRKEPPILKFAPSGTLLKSWGAGAYVFPHGFHLDAQGNVWVSDAQGKDGRGHQVFKYSPDGTLLMTIGTAGVEGDGAAKRLQQPTDIVTAPNGDIFITEGHVIGGGINRVSKWTKDGAFIKAWGKTGSGPGEFNVPHTIAIDSRGRLFVGDRANNRIQIFDQNGIFLDEWTQFGRPSGITITKDDTIYVADSESWGPDEPGWKKGIRVGSAKDGSVKYLIEDIESTTEEHSGAEGVGVDRDGNVYGSVVRRMMLEKHILKK